MSLDEIFDLKGFAYVNRRMHQAMQLSPFLRSGALLGLYSLDLFDLYAKVAWIGPSESLVSR